MPIQFIINFPVQTPLPRLVSVSFDNRIICGQSGTCLLSINFMFQIFVFEGNLMMRRHVLHKIEFRYTFNTTEINADHSFIRQVLQQSTKKYQLVDTNQRESFRDPTTANPQMDRYNNFFFLMRTHTIRISNYSSQTKCGLLHDKFASTPLIAGGSTIDRGSWPWLVAIYNVKSTGPLFLCAGSLVSAYSVLTAASCFYTTLDKSIASDLLVIAGRHNLSDWLERDTASLSVLMLHIHPDFRPGFPDDDIALLILTNRVRFNEFVLPVCLWTNLDEPQDPTRLIGTIVGWAAPSDGKQPLATIPESVTVPAVAENVCRRTRDIVGGRRANQSFCAGNRNNISLLGACYGDLGSGFVTLRSNRLSLRGIVTKVEAVGAKVGNTCDMGNYLLLTDVAKYTDWYRRNSRI